MWEFTAESERVISRTASCWRTQDHRALRCPGYVRHRWRDGNRRAEVESKLLIFTGAMGRQADGQMAVSCPHPHRTTARARVPFWWRRRWPLPFRQNGRSHPLRTTIAFPLYDRPPVSAAERPFNVTTSSLRRTVRTGFAVPGDQSVVDDRRGHRDPFEIINLGFFLLVIVERTSATLTSGRTQFVKKKRKKAV